MNNKCILNLLNYKVEQIYFELNNDFKMTDDETISVEPKLARKIEKIDKDKCKVSLGFMIHQTAEKTTPFNIEAWVSGEFKVEDWENKNNKMVNVNTVAILFPFLRALIATITSNASVPPYILPAFNVVAWFEEEEKKLQGKNSSEHDRKN